MFKYLRSKFGYFSPKQIQKWRNFNLLFRTTGIGYYEPLIEDFYSDRKWVKSWIARHDQNTFYGKYLNIFDKSRKDFRVDAKDLFDA